MRWVFGGRCIFTFGHDMLSVGGGGKSSLSIALYEDVDPLLCDADLASDTVQAVFDVTRELEYKVVDLVVELMIEAI